MSAASHTLRSWLLTTDHRRIAILYLVTLPLVGLAGFVPALLLRAGLLTPARDLLETEGFQSLSLWHGSGMVLLMLLPAIPAGLGYAVFGRPAAPRVALASWYLWLIACAVWLARMVQAEPEARAAAWLAAVSLGLTFLSLILTLRRRRQPLTPFAWSIAFAGGAGLARLATGSAEPAVLAPLALVPALGVVAEVIRDSSGGVLYGERIIPWLLGGAAAATLLPWGSRLLANDFGPIVSALLPLAALPPAMLVAALLATVLRRPPARGPAMAFAWASIGLAIVAGGAFLLLASVPTNTHLAATAFESAHLHYIAGVVLAALLAGLYHWRDAITGRALPQAAANSHARLVFGAWTLTFFPDFVAGYLGQPWALSAYPDSFGTLQTVSSLGALVLAAALAASLRGLLRSLFSYTPEPGERRAASRMSE